MAPNPEQRHAHDAAASVGQGDLVGCDGNGVVELVVNVPGVKVEITRVKNSPVVDFKIVEAA